MRVFPDNLALERKILSPVVLHWITRVTDETESSLRSCVVPFVMLAGPRTYVLETLQAIWRAFNTCSTFLEVKDVTILTREHTYRALYCLPL